MKKTLAVILCVCMMLALFAGCGESASTQQPAAAQTEAPAEPADENALPEQYDLIMTFGPESGIAGNELELHPGAARYYKEAGVA